MGRSTEVRRQRTAKATTTSVRHVVGVFLVTALLLPAVVFSVRQTAEATTTLGPATEFEIDGSVQSQGLGDWGGALDFEGPVTGTQLHGPGLTPDGYETSGVYYYNRDSDPCGVANDDIGASGVKIEDGPIWQQVLGSSPDKDDLQAISLAAERVNVPGAGGGQINDIVYASFERCDDGGPGGSMSTILFVETGDGLFPSQGGNGDFLFRFDFNPNTGATDIEMFERIGGSWSNIPIPANAAEGRMELTKNDFGEVALNLTTLGILPSDTCRTVSITGAVATIAGGSLNSQAKDLVQVTPLAITNCGSVEITKTTNLGATTETFAYSLDQIDNEPSHSTDLNVSGVGSTTEPDADFLEVDAVITTGTTDTWVNMVSEPDYQLVETLTPAQIAAGWSIDEIRCSFVDVFDSDDDLNTTEVIEVVLHDGTDYTGEGFLIAPAAIGPNPIAASTCEITNAVTGLVITKQGTGDVDQPFDIAVNGVGLAPALTIGDSSPILPLIANSAVTITEALPATTPGWQTTSIECTHAAANPLDPPVVVASATNASAINFTAVQGQIVECVITNDQQSQIVIEKLTDPAVTNDVFGFTLTGLPAIVGLGSGASAGTGDVAPGTYTITEVLPAADPPWALGGVTCGGVAQPVAANAVTVTVTPGQVLTCTFTNAALATLIVDKTVTGAVSDATFSFAGVVSGSITTVGGATTPGDELSATVLPGSYQVDETATPGYTLESVTCDDVDSVQSGSGAAFEASAGETVTCTYTNTRNSATFTLEKEWGPFVGAGQSIDLTATVGGAAPLGAGIATTATAPAGAAAVNTIVVYSGQTVTFDEVFVGSDALFQTALACTSDADGSAVAFTPGADNRSGTWDAGDNPVDVTCTFTNSLIPPTLTLVKDVVNDNGGTSVPADWTLEATGFVAGTPVAGTYTLSESGPAGYSLTSLTCDNAAGQVSQVTLAIAEDVTCTFVNDDDAPLLTLIKEVVNDNGGTSVPAAWTLEATGFDPANPQIGTYALSESGPTGYSLTSLTCDNAAGEVTQVTLTLGEDVTCTFVNDDNPLTLTLVKQVVNDNGGTSVPADWTLTAAGFDAASPQTGTYVLSESGPNGYSLTSLTCDNAVGQVTEVTLGLGEDVTCTFVNDDDAPSLTLVKQVVNDSGGISVPADWTLTAAGFNPANPQAGTYVLGESGPVGYSLASLTCDNAVGQVTEVMLGLGEDVTCTFVNDDDAPSLTLVKQVINDNGGTSVPGDWTLEATGFDAGDPQTGTYALGESGPIGYSLTSLTCDNAVGEVTQVTLTLGEAVTCTFVNDDDAPSLTLVKQVINDNGGTSVPSDWTLTAGVFTAADPQTGSYVLSESGPVGYSLTSLTCDNAVGEVTQVTLGLGEAVTCTFVNDDDAPSLTLIKQVVNDADSNALPSDWTLTATGFDQVSPQIGTFPLVETGGPPGFDLTSLTCDNVVGQVTSATISLGEDVTCTFVNTTDGRSSIDVAKTASPTQIFEPSDPVAFTFAITNTSANDTVTIETLDDSIYGDLAGQGDCAVPQTLAPTESYSCTASFDVTGSPGDSVTNVLTASGIDDDGDPVSGTDDAVVEILDVPSMIDVNKTASVAAIAENGGDVTFTFTITNDSPVDTVEIDYMNDDIYGDLDGQGDCSVPQTLAPGEVYTCSIIGQVIGNAGTVHVNVVSVSGIDDDGANVGASDDAMVVITDLPSSIEVTKVADLAQVPASGADVTFTVTVTNTSQADSVTINSVIDDVFGDISASCVPAVPGVTLAPAELIECLFVENISGDPAVDHRNVVTATGTDDDGNDLEADDDEEIDILSVELGIDKRFVNWVDVDGSLNATEGDVLEYIIVATNIGEAPLNNVTVVDSLTGDSTVCLGPVAPGAECVLVDIRYPLQQSDINTGSVLNVGTADSDETPPVDDEEEVPLDPDPSIVVDKRFTAHDDVNSNGFIDVDETLTYVITATNTGNVTLDPVLITDELTGTDEVPCVPATLDPQESCSLEVEYVVTADDLAAGEILNVAIASGFPPGCPGQVGPLAPADQSAPLIPDCAVEDDDTERVPIDIDPEIQLIKTATLVANSQAPVVGDVIEYTFDVTNVGNVRLEQVTLVDELPGLSTPVCDWPASSDDSTGPDELSVQERVTCVAEYRLTMDDLVRGFVLNVALSTGMSPTDEMVEDDDETETPLPIVSAIDLQKTATADTVQTGATITYTFVATNTSTVPLADVTVTDPLPGLSALTCSTPGGATTLAPGEAMTCTATYLTSAADGNQVVNTATATGVDPRGATVSDTDDQVVQLTLRRTRVFGPPEPPPAAVPEPPTVPDEVLGIVVEPPLAQTGVDSRDLTIRSLLLIAFGAVFVGSSRRRES